MTDFFIELITTEFFTTLPHRNNQSNVITSTVPFMISKRKKKHPLFQKTFSTYIKL